MVSYLCYNEICILQNVYYVNVKNDLPEVKNDLAVKTCTVSTRKLRGARNLCDDNRGEVVAWTWCPEAANTIP